MSHARCTDRGERATRKIGGSRTLANATHLALGRSPRMTGVFKSTRVCIDARLISGYAGGVETVLIGLASGLSSLDDGDEEYLLLTYRGEDDWLRPYVRRPVRIVPVSPPSIGYRLGVRFRRARDFWRRVPMIPGVGNGLPPVSDGTAEKLGAHVVHLALQRGFRTAIPTIYNPHDLQHRHLPGLFTERERRTREIRFGALMEQARMVVVTSSWGRRDLIEQYGLPEEKVAVVPWAPILSEYATAAAADMAGLRRRLALPDDFVFYPAQTWPHKNHVALLEALALLRRRGLIVPLVSSGFQTSFFSVLVKRARELGVTDQVYWLGFVGTSDLKSLYDLSRAVVIPTRFEAASGPLWEAFQAGVPAACSNVTSLPDQAGDAALIFDPDNIEAIANAIRSLWVDPDLRHRLVARGRANVARFSWDLTARMYRAHYRRLAGRELTGEDRRLLKAPAIL